MFAIYMSIYAVIQLYIIVVLMQWFSLSIVYELEALYRGVHSI